MAETGSSAPRNRISLSRRWWLVASMALVSAVSLFCLLVLVPAAVRALPGRYAARLPDFLQELRRRPHPDILPTPAIIVEPFFLPSSTPESLRLSGVAFVTSTPTSSRGSNGQGIDVSLTPETTSRPTRLPTAQSTGTATSPPTATLTRVPTFSPLPPTPTRVPTSTPLPPTPTATPVPLSASLPPITHTYQTWNNCGPATLSMALLYFGQTGTQADVAAFLKPDPEDKNVGPDEMATFVRALGLEATVRVDGDVDRLKALIAGGFPVVVETWFIPEPGDQMGHYRLLTGYDDHARQFITQDSYNGPNVGLDYDAFDEMWRVFNRVYLIIYRVSQAEMLASILADDVKDEAMHLGALDTAQEEALNPSAECVAYEDCTDGAAFAWFNVGSSLTSLGRHQDAAAAYDQARLLGLPWRMLWYQFGPYESYYAVGRYEDVITLATVTLNVVDNLEESYYWRGMAYLAQESTDLARSDFQAAIKYNPNFGPAQKALASLEED